MNRFQIFSDSTTDLTEEMASSWNVMVVPTDFMVAGRTYREFPDRREMDPAEFYRIIRKGEMPKTAVINPSRFIEYFTPVLQDGLDILYIVFSSGLSVTMQNALIAARELKESFKDRVICIVDTLSVSLGGALLVRQAARMRDEGSTMEEIQQWVLENRLKVCHWFTVDDLNHLRRGGRITATSALAGGVLFIKPILRVSDEGTLEPVEKVRGRQPSLDRLVSHVLEATGEEGQQTIMIAHADCLKDAQYLKQELEQRCKVQEIIISDIGAVIGAHTGPGAVAVFCFGKNR